MIGPKKEWRCKSKQEWRYKSRRVRTHHSTPRVAVRRLGRIIQRIFLPNQEAALVEPFGNGLVRVGSPGAFFALLVNMRRFISLPDLFPLAPTNRPWVPEDDISLAISEITNKSIYCLHDYRLGMVNITSKLRFGRIH